MNDDNFEQRIKLPVSSNDFRSATAVPELWQYIGALCSRPTQNRLRSVNRKLAGQCWGLPTSTLYFIENIQKVFPLKFILHNLTFPEMIIYPQGVLPDEIIKECINLLTDILLSNSYDPKKVNIISANFSEVLRLNQDNPILRFFEIIINPVKKTNSSLAIYSLWKIGVNNIYFLKTDTLPEVKDIQLGLLNSTHPTTLYHSLLSCKENPSWNLMFALNYARTVNFIDQVCEFTDLNEIPVKARIVLSSLTLFNISYLIFFAKDLNLFCTMLRIITQHHIELLRKKYIFNCLVHFLHASPCDLPVEIFLEKFKGLDSERQLNCLGLLKKGMSATLFFQRNGVQTSFRFKTTTQRKRDRKEHSENEGPVKALRANSLFFEVERMIPFNPFSVEPVFYMDTRNTFG